ncbi:hypothetical protein B0T18DRAFT_133636 [Schizothecium vesticola]|uniref:Uncharacterized protein n=1 Tax=Schizothecium vesticola TaxID=314040 RepID=A0AA40EU32_9PEZI|nr:hypothetical protein B0T18DRAFT_133636 [Schizothecium vesticola]
MAASRRWCAQSAVILNRSTQLPESGATASGSSVPGSCSIMYNPDEDAIGMVSRTDLRKVPDAVIIVGTTLKIPGIQRLVCKLTKSRRGGIRGGRGGEGVMSVVAGHQMIPGRWASFVAGSRRAVGARAQLAWDRMSFGEMGPLCCRK